MFTKCLPVVTLLLLLSGCRDGRLGEIDRQFRASPDTILVPPTWVGDEGTAVVTASNLSRSSLTVSWTLEGGFTTDEHVATLAAGEQRAVTVRFRPQGAGVFSGTMTFDTPVGQAAVRIEATAAQVPSCAPSSECRDSHFDRATGQCVTTEVNEGGACGVANLCLSNARCVKGACLGVPTNCDDGSVCTADSCNAQLGCLHEATTASCPATNDPCKAPTCDPATGCGVANVADGTPCGSVDCATANICLNGACQAVVPPDGFECSEASPCQGAGHCMNKTCVAPSPAPLSTEFSLTAAYESRNPGLTDEDGNVYWTEITVPQCPDLICPPLVDGGAGPCMTFECDPVRTAQLVSVTRAGLPRYRTTLCQQAVGGACSEWVSASTRIMWGKDRIIGVSDEGTVVAVDASTGAIAWKQDVRAWVPGAGSIVRVRDAALNAQRVLGLVVMRDHGGTTSANAVDAGAARVSALVLVSTGAGALIRLMPADAANEWEYLAFRADGSLLAEASLEAASDKAGPGGCLSQGEADQPGLGTAAPCQTHSATSAFTSSGDRLWRSEHCRAAAPVAPIGARAFTRTGWFSATDGQPWASVLDGGVSVLGNGTSTWLQSRDLTPLAVADVWPWPTTWSLFSGNGSTTLASYGAHTTEALLTRQGDALVVTRDGGPGAMNPGPWEVVATRTDGGTRFRCQLPFPHDSLEPWLGVGSFFTVKKGVLTLQVNQDCPYCLHGVAPRMQGFALPGVEISTDGWSAASGGLHRASREGR